MSKEPLNIGDFKNLHELGDKMASQLEALTDDEMKKYSEKLLGLQWWAFVEKHLEDWKRYTRLLKRDDIL